MARRWAVLGFGVVLTFTVGCAQGEGETCQQKSDCESGLFCCPLNKAVVERGTCHATCMETTRDAGTTGTDAGGTSGDAGSTRTDAGSETTDSGVMSVDAGAIGTDAGLSVDAGFSAPDAGFSLPDAGSPSDDAGTTSGTDAGSP